MEWPAKAQEIEFGVIRSKGKRRTASSLSRPKNRQNRANLLIMVSSRFQRSIQVEWPAKTQETDFGAIGSRGKRRTASSWSRPKKGQKLLQGSNWGNLRKTNKKTPKPCHSANNGVFPFPTLDSGGMACKNTGNEFGVIWSRGKRRTALSWSRPKKTPKVAPGSKIGVIC